MSGGARPGVVARWSLSLRRALLRFIRYMLLRIQLAALLAFSLPCRAESWDALRSLRAGDPIRVLEASGKERKGAFVAVSADAMSVRTRRDEVKIARGEVRLVQIRSNRRRLRNALIGVGIGVVIGVVADQTIGLRFRNESPESAGARALTYAAPIALFGGLGSAT